MYTGEDTDELTFEPGDIVCVIPWEDPEEQVPRNVASFVDSAKILIWDVHVLHVVYCALLFDA